MKGRSVSDRSVHAHVLLADGNVFYCENCSASVEVVPLVEHCLEGVRITASARVRDAGIGGFTIGELGDLAHLWLGLFQSYVESQRVVQSGLGRRHRRMKWSDPQFVRAFSDPSGVDRSAA